MTEQAPGTPLPPAVVTNTVGGDDALHTSVQAGTVGAVHFHQPRHEPPVPRQLRPVAPAWTDREREQTQLTRWIETQPEYAVPIAVLTGPVGIGKTELAERLLHELSGRYPGGQLHVDLRGQNPDGPARPGEVLGRMLRSILPGPLPAGAGELASWWRSATAARAPMCLLLDGVSRADQIHRLLPGGSGHLVVAISRIPLPELARHGAATLALSPLDHAAARAALVEVEDPHDAARALAWLGRAYSMAGRHDEARQAGATAQQEFEQTGSRQWMARSLELLGESVAAAGNEEEARELFARALASYEPLSASDAARVRARLT